jgi:carboxyl-terminal processing protease
MHTETLYMVRCLSGIHYERRPISALSREEILDAYLEDLDPQRLFFLQSDVDAIHSRYNLTLDIFLNSGSVKPAFAIYEIFRSRANARMDHVDELLRGNPNFSDAEFYEPDRKDVPWSTAEEELEDLWRRRLEFELLNEMLLAGRNGEEGKTIRRPSAGKKSLPDGKLQPDGEEDLQKSQENLRRRFTRFRESVNDVEPYLVQELFLNSVAGLYDPHSSFLSASTWEDFQSSALTNSLMGIGAALQDDDGYCKVVEIYPGSPAERSGQLRVGDKILAVQNGEEEPVDIIGMRLNRVVKLIRGPKGTPVTLHVQPADGDPSERKIVSLLRDEIQLTSQRARARVYSVPDRKGKKTIPLGYLKLPAFYGSSRPGEGGGSCGDVTELLQKLSTKEIEGLVVDLRGNTGGLLDEAIAIAGLFLGGGPVVQVRDGEGHVQVFSDASPEILYQGPLVILTSKQSASASEILAGALQDHRRAIVVGDKTTYGKGSVQAILPMNQSFLFLKNGPQLGAARITIQKWYRPRGKSIQRQGVAADIPLPSFNDALPFGEADNGHALAWDAVPEAPWEGLDRVDPWVVSEELIDFLRVKSESRKNFPERKLLEERVARFGEKVQQKQFSLEIEERRRQRDGDRAYRQRLEEKILALAEKNYPFTDVLLDAAQEGENGQKQGGGRDGDDLPELDVQLLEALHITVDWRAAGSRNRPLKASKNP